MTHDINNSHLFSLPLNNYQLTSPDQYFNHPLNYLMAELYNSIVSTVQKREAEENPLPAKRVRLSDPDHIEKSNQYRRWTQEENRQLLTLDSEGKKTNEIAGILQRSPAAIRTHKVALKNEAKEACINKMNINYLLNK